MTASRIGSIQIPEEEQGIFGTILELNETVLESLEKALQKATPTLLKQALVAQLKLEPALSELTNLDGILDAIMSLASTAYSVQASTKDLVAAAIAQIKEDGIVDLNDHYAAELESRLDRLLNTTCVELVAKGNILVSSGANMFRSARILSDFRPIYTGEESALTISAGVIVHQLAIKFSRNKKSDVVYLSLDSEDLGSLKEAISRAITKDQNLRQFAANSGAPVLTSPAE